MNDQRSATPDADDLRERFASVAPVILVDPAPVARRGRRRRGTVRALLGLGAVAALVAVVVLPRAGGGTTAPADVGPPPVEPDRPVAVRVLPEVVGPGDVVMTVLQAREVNDLTFGVAAEVQRWDGGAWRPVGEAMLCPLFWSCVGTVTDRLDGVPEIGLGAGTPDAPGATTLLSTEGLVDGWYRVVQRAALDAGLATGVFEVRTGAPAAPPQPDGDDVRLTVEPSLVPTGGGEVRVTTQVPPDAQGSLDAGDVAAVDDALDPTARVQRWDDGVWLDVAEVPVQAREAALGPEWGSPLVLPALPEGSYRVVRAGAGAGEPWGVFAVRVEAPVPAPVEPGQ